MHTIFKLFNVPFFNCFSELLLNCHNIKHFTKMLNKYLDFFLVPQCDSYKIIFEKKLFISLKDEKNITYNVFSFSGKNRVHEASKVTFYFYSPIIIAVQCRHF